MYRSVKKNTKNELILLEFSKEIIVKNDTPKEEGESHPIVEKLSDEVLVSRDNLAASMRERGTLATNIKSSMKNTETQFRTTGEKYKLSVKNNGTQFQTMTETTMPENTSVIEQVRYISPMESLRNKDFTLTKIALNSSVITPIIFTNLEAKPIRQHTYLNMSITPIQTYRILIINNHSIQKVQTSNLFDSERNGWQFDLEIIKPIGKLWNFRTNLSYLRIRQ